MGLYLGGFIIGRIFASEIWGAYFRKGLFFFFFWGGGYFWGGLFWGGRLSSKFYGILKSLHCLSAGCNTDMNICSDLSSLTILP